MTPVEETFLAADRYATSRASSMGLRILLIERICRAIPGPLRRALIGVPFDQLLRFAVGGLGVTLLSAAVYLAGVYALQLSPLTANAVSHSCGVVVSYLVHSRWTFSRRQAAKELSMLVRFCVVSAVSFGINAFWVAILTGLLDLPAIAPVPLMVLATPLISFVLNRHWVFEAASGASKQDKCASPELC